MHRPEQFPCPPGARPPPFGMARGGAFSCQPLVSHPLLGYLHSYKMGAFSFQPLANPSMGAGSPICRQTGGHTPCDSSPPKRPQASVEPRMPRLGNATRATHCRSWGARPARPQPPNRQRVPLFACKPGTPEARSRSQRQARGKATSGRQAKRSTGAVGSNFSIELGVA